MIRLQKSNHSLEVQSSQHTPPIWTRPNPNNIPEDLKKLPWGVWKASIRSDKNGVIRVDKEGRPKWNKAPLNPRTGYPATSTKPETFGTFEEALAAYETGQYSGIGVLLTGNGEVGFDLDNTNQLFKEKPKVHDWFQNAYSSGVYSERSPSKTGVRLFGIGTLPSGGRNHSGIEIYNNQRFLTVTGDIGRKSKGALGNTSLINVQSHIESFLEFFPAKDEKAVSTTSFQTTLVGSKSINDIPINVKARLPRIFGADAQATDKYRLLFQGNTLLHGGDTSKATLSLVRHLLISGLKPEEADLVIRASGLYRDKWDSKRGNSTWGNKEIETASGYVEKVKAELFPETKTINELSSNTPTPPELTEAPPDSDETISVIKSFNTEYFTAPEGSNTYVFRESWDYELEHSRLERQTFDGFKKLHPEKVLHNGRQKQAAALWLDSPLRRNYKNGIVFLPNGNTKDGVYNLWKEFGVKPMQGNAAPILDYLKDIICDNNESNYDYLLNWLAFCVQYPERQGGVAVVCRGEKGTGKGTLGRIMTEIFGAHGIQISHSRHLTGNFNAHLRAVAFLFSDEAFFAGDKAGEGVLKSIITEDKIVIEQKGVDAVAVKNRLKIIMASNNDWVIPTSADERRFFCLDVSSKRREDHKYWDELNNFIKKGGTGIFLSHLLSINLAGFNVYKVPNTSGLDSQKLQSLGSIESLVHDWLYSAEIKCGWGSGIDWKQDEAIKVSCTDIQEAIQKHCKHKHIYKTPSLEEIGRKLKKIINAERKQQRNKAIGREYIYIFPPLNEARALFCKDQKLSEQHWEKVSEIEMSDEKSEPVESTGGFPTSVAKLLEKWDVAD